MTRSLIVGVDDTDDGRNALARAAEWARVAGLRLVVVHVRHIPVLTEMSSMTIGPARQNLDLIEAAVRRATEDALQGTDADWEFVVRSGDPAHELMAVARDRAALAIVVGGRPHKAALSGLAGSVSAALVHRFQRLSARRPRQRPNAEPRDRFRPVPARRHLGPLAPHMGEHHAAVRSDLP